MKIRGFTLVETIVAIAIITLIAAIVLPVLSQAKVSAKEAQSLSNLRQIAAAVLMYSENDNGRFPLSTTYDGAVDLISGTQQASECVDTGTIQLIDEPLMQFVRSERLFVSPFLGPQAPGKYGVRRIGYEGNCRLVYRDYIISSLPLPGDTTLALEADANPRKINGLGGLGCVFDDGHAKVMSRIGCLLRCEPDPQRR